MSTVAYSLSRGFLHVENLDLFGQVELMVLKVSAKESRLSAGVSEGDAQVADNRRLIFLYAQLGVALLEHHLFFTQRTSKSIHFLESSPECRDKCLNKDRYYAH